MTSFNQLTGNDDSKRWQIGYIPLSASPLLSPELPAFPAISPSFITTEEFAFLADPFAVNHDGRCYVFAEAWSKAQDRGVVVAFVAIDDDFDFVGVALQEPYHLSWPLVFNDHGTLFMLPEAWESGEMWLYRATTFPLRWEKHQLVYKGDYADPQLFTYQGLYYILFTADPLANRTTHLLCAPSVLGPWRQHPASPVITDNPRLARGAGRLFFDGGALIRPSQDCSTSYGQTVTFSQIVKLDTVECTTRPVHSPPWVRPQWMRDGFHHIDIAQVNGNAYLFVDGYARSFET